MTEAARIDPGRGPVSRMVSSCLLSAPERKRAEAEAATVSADGEFSGYASLFGVEDMSHDIVERGAFLVSLSRRGVSGVKMLYQHDPAEPIGRWLDIRETAKGLFVVGQLMPEIARAREVLAMMRAGVIDGLSIGFKTVKGRSDAKSGIRRLTEVDLWEISVVTFPMQPAARVASVKAAAAIGSSALSAAADWPFAGLDAEEDRRLSQLFRRLSARVSPGR
ncbi:MAG: HK97 family phage prohead protease [Ancalomicrobiaceae bacterium]|nr:HK97 family phage prohead protease [Ancalomicrobiaceae bacterium]